MCEEEARAHLPPWKAPRFEVALPQSQVDRYTTEGCATFYKTTRFKRLDKAIFDYDKLSQQEPH